MSKEAETHRQWCFKNNMGNLRVDSIKKNWADVAHWKDKHDVLPSAGGEIIQVELVEKGKHPDTVRLKKFFTIINGCDKVTTEQIITKAAFGMPLQQAIDDAAGREDA